jgi:ribulose-5-phosphate 4-epimerase/fuculose-1-phosphate aldolase
MEKLIRKYTDKLHAGGLVEKDAPLMGALDAEVAWNRSDRLRPVLEGIFARLNINALLFSQTAEPYRSIIEYLAKHTPGAIRPSDTETRTFLHSIPIVAEFTADAVADALRQSKSAIIPGYGIVTFGTVSPEQAFITFSSVCFSCYVKFFADYLRDRRQGKITAELEKVFESATSWTGPVQDDEPALAQGPFASEEDVLTAIEACGLRTVRCRLVDSYFGNISYRFKNTLYISQTSSSLDELRGAIDPCPLDGSSCVGITASSELTAHREIVLKTENRAVLHGHPKFPVILSMDCSLAAGDGNQAACAHAAMCHRACPEERFIADIPIVPGEIGTGPYGLCNTVPPAIRNRRGVIVYGHGVFTAGKNDFNEAFGNMVEIDRICREEYFSRLSSVGHQVMGNRS